MAQPAVEWEPITADRLLDPEDGDWLSYRRTYDWRASTASRFRCCQPFQVLYH